MAGSPRFAHLALVPGLRSGYTFDFGDELRHRIKLEVIVPGSARPEAIYPQTTEQHGAAEPQSPARE